MLHCRALYYTTKKGVTFMINKRLTFSACIIALTLILLSGCQSQEPAHTHTYGQWVVTSLASCTSGGVETRLCDCGETQTQLIAATGHQYGDWVTTVDATCKNTGVKTRTCINCGDSKNENLNKTDHQYDNGMVTTEATCQNSGVKTYTCNTCNTTKTETIAKQGHAYNSGEVTKEATCQNSGTKTYTCNTCNTTKTETIAKLAHAYGSGEITTQPTCNDSGVKTYTCTACNATKTETIAKLGHAPNSNNICTRCGSDCPIDLNMSASEIADAKKVHWISERSIDNLEDENQFRLMFSLKDSNENWLKVPVIVTIKITNDNGELIYKATKVVKVSDYSGWTNGYGKQWTAAAVYIPYSDITPGTTSAGTISFEVYNDYVSFDTSTLKISSGLPLKPTTIIMPILPETLYEYGYKDSITSSVKITDITYEVVGDDLYIYFTGEKLYDKEGNRYSRSCKVGWKLYDSDGYIIDSGTFYSPSIAVGEKFRNEKAYAWDVIKPGETYRLEISSVD